MSFVYEFEQLYGEENMVFNMHLLHHLSSCVEHNGPLQYYSNYNMEDNMGHMLRNVHGTNDAVQQICENYLMEKELRHTIVDSPIASEYHLSIQAQHRFPISTKFGNLHVIGNVVTKPMLSYEEESFIMSQLMLNNNEELRQYNTVLLNNGTYYETIDQKIKYKKSTNDHFICDSGRNIFGDIKAFIEVGGKLWVFIHNVYKKRGTSPITCDSVIWLENKHNYDYYILDGESLGKKYIFLKDQSKIACVEFTNNTKRN